ncbi:MULTISPECIES: arsenate reductase ArsC [unclassified Tolypothrix]|uniref:arsenate reductase ArsC n=1 Tax=unclassified Tolypothrix TaxID=2649714 RepID=UPI0005EAC48D|nr:MULTISPECIES: arsenate reductase ArsC [unclassified Tolypothrix]BAY89709.1 arsenate reductase [Microchaete diplosiphon NIES-3275]EKE97582.1 putative arsenate reductase [Tolypothrix sp. PCC 7601]MBE9083185.1 arsenate reductase ArsC [Tolypothrix sp. LEGE 11397]UYD23972.1 arsenate reductase ArsC [Tolypothrix sp. PCC 7712]UYD33800.1 arsenate reductase ArsC [Tolypothrix sp. PCC 7601]
MDLPLLLILCTGNSCRSQIAEGVLKELADDLFTTQSAGMNPAKEVHPLAIKVMQEIGIDISQNYCKHINLFLDQKIDTVITVCDHADQSCPTLLSSIKRHHFSFPDPAEATGTEIEKLQIFRQVRDDISKLFLAYVAGRRDAFSA